MIGTMLLNPIPSPTDDHSQSSSYQQTDTHFSGTHGHHDYTNQFGGLDPHALNNPHYQNFDPNTTGGTVIGNPVYDMQFWHHQSYNDCDIVLQQMGLESLTGKHFSDF